jgi:hypothetical protein
MIRMERAITERFEILVKLLQELSRHSEELVYVVHMNNKFLEKLFNQMKNETTGGLTP